MKVEDPKGKSVEENMRPTDRLNKGPSICNIKREQVLAKDISFLSFNGVNSLMFCFFFTKSITWGKGEWRVSPIRREGARHQNFTREMSFWRK